MKGGRETEREEGREEGRERERKKMRKSGLGWVGGGVGGRITRRKGWRRVGKEREWEGAWQSRKDYTRGQSKSKDTGSRCLGLDNLPLPGLFFTSR